MDEFDRNRLRGLRNLVRDAIENGSTFVEKHHRVTSGKVFRVVGWVEPLESPVRVVKSVHDGVLSISYGGVRFVNRVGSRVVERVLAPDPPEEP